MKKIFTLLSLVLLLMSSTCQKPTGFYLVDNTIDKNLYSEKNTLYIYRSSCLIGAAVNIVIELNNKFRGVLGMNQIVKVPFELGINHLVVEGDIASGQYAVLLDIKKENSRYFISSFCRANKLITTEYEFEDWVKAITE